MSATIARMATIGAAVPSAHSAAPAARQAAEFLTPFFRGLSKRVVEVNRSAVEINKRFAATSKEAKSIKDTDLIFMALFTRELILDIVGPIIVQNYLKKQIRNRVGEEPKPEPSISAQVIQSTKAGALFLSRVVQNFLEKQIRNRIGEEPKPEPSISAQVIQSTKAGALFLSRVFIS